MYELKIKFSQDFEKRYKKYKAGILSTQQLTEIKKTDNLGTQPPFPNLSANSDSTKENQMMTTEKKREGQLKALKKIVREGQIDEMIAEREKRREIKGVRNELLIFHTEDGIELKFNELNGDFVFGEIKGGFALGTQAYKVFQKLLKAPSHQVQYADLLKELYPEREKEFKEPLMQADRWILDSVIRDIKNALGILPKKKSKNKNIFTPLKKWKGYRLMLTD